MSPKTLLATVVVVAVAAADAFSSNDALADLVVNLVTLDSTELIVVSDFVRPDQAQLLRLLNEVSKFRHQEEHKLFHCSESEPSRPKFPSTPTKFPNWARCKTSCPVPRHAHVTSTQNKLNEVPS